MVNFRLIKLVESRIHREVYVRFGGEYPKIRHRNMKMDVGCLAYIPYYSFRRGIQEQNPAGKPIRESTKQESEEESDNN